MVWSIDVIRDSLRDGSHRADRRFSCADPFVDSRLFIRPATLLALPPTGVPARPDFHKIGVPDAIPDTRVQLASNRCLARLSFLVRAALRAGLRMAAATWVLECVPVGAIAAATWNPGDLAGRINPSPDCLQAVVVGPCYCGTVPCGYWLRMFVPAAFVETVVRPGDSLLSGTDLAASLGRAAPPGTGSASLSTTDDTAEAHVWTLKDQMLLLSRLPPCVTCRPSDARVPASSGSLATSGTTPCDPTGAVATAILDAGSKIDIPLLPALAYASELDAINWHTGCRDQSLARVLAGNGLTCTAAGVAQWLYGDNPLARLVGADACLGRWGPLYPRQMRDIGNNPVVHSAKSGYRALSIARDQLGLLPIPVDLSARMQQAYPAVSACFGIGELPLPQLPTASDPTVATPDGRYGWFYWRPVACCVRFDSYADCVQGRR